MYYNNNNAIIIITTLITRLFNHTDVHKSCVLRETQWPCGFYYDQRLGEGRARDVASEWRIALFRNRADAVCTCIRVISSLSRGVWKSFRYCFFVYFQFWSFVFRLFHLYLLSTAYFMDCAVRVVHHIVL